MKFYVHFIIIPFIFPGCTQIKKIYITEFSQKDAKNITLVDI